MALPSLAPVSDLAAWVGQAIEPGDLRAGAVLSAASALVRAYAGQNWVDENGDLADVPDVVAAVVVQAAARVWANPHGAVAAALDDGSLRWSEASASGLFLTDADKAVLDAYQEPEAGSFGLGTVSLAGGSLTDSTIYVPTGPPPAGYPFPWYSAEDFDG